MVFLKVEEWLTSDLILYINLHACSHFLIEEDAITSDELEIEEITSYSEVLGISVIEFLNKRHILYKNLRKESHLYVE